MKTLAMHITENLITEAREKVNTDFEKLIKSIRGIGSNVMFHTVEKSADKKTAKLEILYGNSAKSRDAENVADAIEKALKGSVYENSLISVYTSQYGMKSTFDANILQ